MADTHYAHRHWQFVRDCLIDIGNTFKSCNEHLTVFQGDTLAIFNTLAEYYEIRSIFSHQETGLHITYEVDKALAKWCKSNNITWKEFQAN